MNIEYIAICKKDWFILPNGGVFEENKSYKYFVKKHDETGIPIFHIINEDFDIPANEKTFNKYFNDTQRIRNLKIDELLKNI
jgi:hypothetical protein